MVKIFLMGIYPDILDVYPFPDTVVQEAACPGGVASPGQVFAVTAVHASLYQFLPDVNKAVVDRVPDYTTTTASSANQAGQDPQITTTPM